MTAADARRRDNIEHFLALCMIDALVIIHHRWSLYKSLLDSSPSSLFFRNMIYKLFLHAKSCKDMAGHLPAATSMRSSEGPSTDSIALSTRSQSMGRAPKRPHINCKRLTKSHQSLNNQSHFIYLYDLYL